MKIVRTNALVALAVLFLASCLRRIEGVLFFTLQECFALGFLTFLSLMSVDILAIVLEIYNGNGSTRNGAQDNLSGDQ